MKRITLALVMAAGLVAAGLPGAVAEVFLLTDGGRIEGELVNRDEKKPQSYIIKLPAGGQMTLDASEVKEVISPPPHLAEYEKVRAQAPDTVEGQLELAKWCRGHKLTEQWKAHLTRVIELDPDHAEARTALGFIRINGRWTTLEREMAAQGKSKYRGKWRTQQEIDQLEQKRDQEAARGDWVKRISRLRGELGSRKGAEARDALAAIDDPAAVRPLASAMGPKGRASPEVRILLAGALANIGTPEAAKVLALFSMDDADDEVRQTCLDHLEKIKTPAVMAFFLERLRSKDNSMINRAGAALGRMKDPTTIGPLIDHLVTVHTIKLGNDNPGAMSFSFPTGGSGGGLGMGMNQRPKSMRMAVKNQSVLAALVAITGQDFGFDQQMWRNWFNARKKTEPVDMRRD